MMPDNSMDEAIKILRKVEQTTTQWSGGTTTQLYIFPEHAEYGKGNFQFRISTATVEEDTSVFTSLPGITRHLMILSGQLSITHEGHYSKQLHPLDIDSFDGGWHTTGAGKVTDFNLMTTGNTKVFLTSVALSTGEKLNMAIPDDIAMIGYYVWEGALNINTQTGSSYLHRHDFMMLRSAQQLKPVHFEAIENCTIILALISLNN
jgi:environmental stress-induced protein Ves